MTNTTAPLRFTRPASTGSYYAAGASHVYTVTNGVGSPGSWYLQINEARQVAGVTIPGDLVDADWHDTKKLAMATAQEFEQLGDDYVMAEHGGKNRLTAAILAAYAA